MKLGHYRREILRTQPPFRALVVGDQVSTEITVGSFYTKTLLEGITVTWKLDGKEFIEPTSSSGVSRLSETVKNLGAQTITAEFHSPYEDKRVEASFDIVVYENSPWEQAKLFINGEQVERNGAFALLRGQENTVTVEVPSDVADELSLELAENGGLNVASSPAFGCWVDRKDNKFTWFLTPDIGKSGRIKLIFLSHKVEQPWEHRCWVLSADLDLEVNEILVDNVPMPAAGMYFNSGEEYTIEAIYNDPDMAGLNLKLDIVDLSGVERADFTSEPPFGEPTPLAKWTFKSAALKAGAFKLQLSTGNGESVMQTPNNRLGVKPLKWTTVFGNPLPVPPEMIYKKLGLPTVLRVLLLNPDGSPIPKRTVTFDVTGKDTQTEETDLTGMANMSILTPRTPGVLVFHATAQHPNGEVSATLLVSYD